MEQSHERRKHPRVEAELTVRFADEQGVFVEECVGNVSKGGMFIETLIPRKLNEVIELFLKIPRTQEEITVQGEVVHVSGKDENVDEYKGLLGMGIRFLLIEPKQKQVLRGFIENLLEQKGAGSRRNARIYDYKQIKVKPGSISEFKTKFMPNISRGGLFIETDEEFTLFDVLDVVLLPPKGSEEIHLKSEVVHIRRTAEKEKETVQGVGIKFIELSKKQQDSIDRFIKQILKSSV